MSDMEIHKNETDNIGIDRSKDDSVKLLKECDSGTKMAVDSISEVLEKIQNPDIKNLLGDSLNSHKQLEKEIHQKLSQMGKEDKQPNPIAKSMSWIKTNVKLAMDESDKTVADLMTDGCDMGVKSLERYLNQYEYADDYAKQVCHRLIDMEEELRKGLQQYL